MKNGIVILNYNDSDNTIHLLEQIKGYKILDSIVIVDNKSTDNSLERLKPLENKKIKIIEAKENKGYAAGNNIGIKYLIKKEEVDNIIISNPDIQITEEAIKTLVSDLAKKEVSLVAPVIEEPNSISKGWHLPTFLSELVSNIPYLRRFEFKILAYKEKEYESALTEVEVVKGCFFIIKKEVFERIHFFDESTFLYYEEVIIGKKLKDLGLKTFVDNRVKAIHHLSASVDKSVKKINKFKLLKKSAYYYEKEIAKMNGLKLGILRMFYYIYLFLLKIRYSIKK